MFRYVSCLVFIFCFQNLIGQSKAVVKGKISNNGIEIPNVSVVEKKSKLGVASNFNGDYSLKISPGINTVVVSAVGFKTKEFLLKLEENEFKNLDVELEIDVLGLDQVVVSATKTSLNRKEAPVLVTVTNAKLLENNKAISLLDGLSFQPGLRTENNCQNCGFTQVRINGLDGAYSQILIDSKPVFSSLNSIYGLEQIPASIIKQIEVIRGGGSALFGANAIAGTINIITKDPVENVFQVSSLFSSINNNAIDAVFNFNSTIVSKNLKRGVIFYGMNRKRDSYDHNNDNFSELTETNTTNFGVKSFMNITDRKKISADFNFSKDYRRGGNMFNKPAHFADISEEIENNIVGFGLNYNYYSKDNFNKLTTYLNYQKTNSDNYYGVEQNPFGYGVTKDDTKLLGLQFTRMFHEFVGESSELTSGVEYKYNVISENRLNPDIEAFEQKVNTLSLFSQLDWKILENLKLLSGFRVEMFESNLRDEKLTILNPRLSVLYNLNKELSIRTSYSNGFRAPQFYSEDIHSEIITGAVRRVVLAENIKTEKSTTIMSSVEYNHSHEGHQLVITLEGFYTRLNNPFIYEDKGEENGLAIKQKINGDKATVKGVNFEFKYIPNSNFLVQLGATAQNGTFSKEYEPIEGVKTDRILRTPNFYGNLIVNYSFLNNYKLNLSGIYTGTMDVPHLAGFIVENTMEKTPEMIEIGLNASYDVNIADKVKIEISGGIKNIFNSYQKDFDQTLYRDPSYIYGPTQPRTVFVGLKIGSVL